MQRGSRRYLNLLTEVALCEFKLKDQSTFFGFAWSFLNPLLMLGVLFILFHARLGNQIPHYPIYMLLGIVQYTHFANCTSAAMRSLLSMRRLVTDAIFPKEILVIGSVLGNSAEFVLSLGACLVIAFASGLPWSWTMLALPAVILLQVVMVLWISVVLAGLHVFVRDIAHIYQVFLRLLLFLTPIFYSRSFLGGSGLAHGLVMVNPLAHLIKFGRMLVLERQMISFRIFLPYLLANVVLLLVSLVLFRKCEPRFAERI